MVHILEKTISLGLRIDMDESKFDIDEKHGKWHPKKRESLVALQLTSQ